MADGAQPARLERVAEAVAEGLRGFRRSNTSISELAEVLRTELGPNELLFLAAAAATALDAESKDRMAEALSRDAAREAAVIDPRGVTERSYAILIKRHRSVGNDAKAAEFERALEGIRARWLKQDTATATEL